MATSQQLFPQVSVSRRLSQLQALPPSVWQYLRSTRGPRLESDRSSRIENRLLQSRRQFQRVKQTLLVGRTLQVKQTRQEDR